MPMLGLELLDAGVIAVAVDEVGGVQARASVDAAGDLTAAANTALDRVATASGDARVLGVAAFNPESTVLPPVIVSLAQRFTGSFAQHGASPAGAAAAVAEAWVGAASGVQDVVFFAVDEHTTGGVIRQGAAMTGARGRAANVAWLSLNPVEREDYRKTGCLEAEVSAAGIVRRLIWRIKAGDRSRVRETVKDDLSAITAQHVLDAARQGDGVSISVVRDTAKYLGMAAANLVVLADPEMLVLGGIMASAADLLLDPMRVEIARRLPRAMMDALAITTASLGADAAAIGAARLAGAALQ
jgi:predicted NBD/HSP70 family sugar kinase